MSTSDATKENVSFLKEVRSGLSPIVRIVFFCWAIFSAFSLFSDLHFLVAALNSIIHIDFSFKDFLIDIGRRISNAVTGYRALMRELAQLSHLPDLLQWLHLPDLPPYIYDYSGIIGFSFARGSWLYRKQRAQAQGRDLLLWRVTKVFVWPLLWVVGQCAEYLERKTKGSTRNTVRNLHDRIIELISATAYACIVAVVVTGLFGVDYLYRHFA